VALLSKWIAADLYAKEIDLLQFELSMTKCSREMWGHCEVLLHQQAETDGSPPAYCLLVRIRSSIPNLGLLSAWRTQGTQTRCGLPPSATTPCPTQPRSACWQCLLLPFVASCAPDICHLAVAPVSEVTCPIVLYHERSCVPLHAMHVILQPC
jgi:hypothetical protein